MPLAAAADRRGPNVGPGERSPRVTFRIPAQTRRLLEQRARDQGRPVADVLREAIEQYLRCARPASGSVQWLRHAPKTRAVNESAEHHEEVAATSPATLTSLR
ncbi:MAG: ribbon-helix-helix protein, CopG family [Pseudonocardiaceae bacterium]